MKLATLNTGGRDGTLVVVSRDLARFVRVPEVAPTLQAALDDWDAVEAELQAISERVNAGRTAGAEPFRAADCAAPLPRAYQWADGSAYVNHVELVRRARNAVLPASFWHDPLMYQGGSDAFLGPCDPIAVESDDWGVDFEGEVAVITGDVPMGASAGRAAGLIRLVMLANDVSLRALIPDELAKGFGFFQSKPSSAFSPVAVTPGELGGAWADGKVNLPLLVFLNGEPFGKAEAGMDMTFSFPRLIAHAARTRPLTAGTIVGSGTVSNKLDGGPGKPIAAGGRGYSCIAELRMVETIESGTPNTGFMSFGDSVRIEMRDATGASIFGAIDQTVVRYEPPR